MKMAKTTLRKDHAREIAETISRRALEKALNKECGLEMRAAMGDFIYERIWSKDGKSAEILALARQMPESCFQRRAEINWIALIPATRDGNTVNKKVYFKPAFYDKNADGELVLEHRIIPHHAGHQISYDEYFTKAELKRVSNLFSREQKLTAACANTQYLVEQSLRSVRTVEALEVEWPEAAAIWHEKFVVSGVKLPSATLVSARKAIEDFPGAVLEKAV
jgi:hypothetical protein